MRSPLESAEITCRDIARVIKKAMPKHWGFVLILASHGNDGFMTYLSDCERDCMIKMLREMAYKLETNDKEI